MIGFFAQLFEFKFTLMATSILLSLTYALYYFVTQRKKLQKVERRSKELLSQEQIGHYSFEHLLDQLKDNNLPHLFKLLDQSFTQYVKSEARLMKFDHAEQIFEQRHKQPKQVVMSTVKRTSQVQKINHTPEAYTAEIVVDSVIRQLGLVLTDNSIKIDYDVTFKQKMTKEVAQKMQLLVQKLIIKMIISAKELKGKKTLHFTADNYKDFMRFYLVCKPSRKYLPYKKIQKELKAFKVSLKLKTLKKSFTKHKNRVGTLQAISAVRLLPISELHMQMTAQKKTTVRRPERSHAPL